MAQRAFASLALTIAILICLGSCASQAAVKEKGPSVYLTDKTQYILLPPSGIEKPLDMAQFVSASYGGKDYYMNAWVKADADGMEISLLSELGAAMGELSYKAGRVQFSSSVFPPSLKPEYIIADFQLCFYDPLLLADALQKCGLALEVKGTTRRVLNGKNIIIEIEKTHNVVVFKNLLRGYLYTLEGEF